MEAEAYRRGGCGRPPDEVLEYIMSLVNQDTGNEVLHCMQVCKQWRSTVPPAISNLMLAWRSRSLADLVQMSKFENLSVLKLNQCKAMEGGWQPLFESLGKNFKHLSTLHLIRVKPNLAEDDLSSLFRQCAALRDLNVDGCLAPPGTLPLAHAPPLESLIVRHVRRLNIPSLHHLPSLKFITISHCLDVISLPPVHTLTNLESLDLSSSYVSVLSPLSNLPQLKKLNLHAVERIADLPAIAEMTQLTSLEMHGCHLRFAATSLARLRNLETLAVTFRPPAQPCPLTHLTCLKRLLLRDNVGVSRLGLPPSLEDLVLSVPGRAYLHRVLANAPKLTSLDISALWINFDMLERVITLRKLHLRDCLFKELPMVHGLAGLQELHLYKCGNVVQLAAPQTLHMLHVEECHRLTTLAGPVTGLKELHMMRCATLSDVSCLESASELTTLRLLFCPGIQVVTWLGNLQSLLDLSLHGLPVLPALPPLGHLSLLERLDLRDLNLVEALPDLDGMSALQRLQVRGCSSLRELPSLSGLRSLQVLQLQFLLELLAVPPLDGLTALREIDLCFSVKLRALPPLHTLSSLRTLILRGCSHLESLPSLQGLTRLLDLDLIQCSSLSDIPSPVGLSPDLEIHTT